MFFLYSCFSYFLFSANVQSGTGQQAQAAAQIWAFVKCLERIGSSRSCPQHCGVILTDAHGNILDSRGFYKVHGSVPEFNLPGNTSDIPSSEMVKYGSAAEIARDWGNVTKYYDRVNPEDYRLWSNNCCSVARGSLAGIRQSNKPLLIDRADSCSIQ